MEREGEVEEASAEFQILPSISSESELNQDERFLLLAAIRRE